MLRKFLLISCLLAVQVLGAQAETVSRNVGGVDLKLAVPNGFCVLDQSNPADKIFHDIVSNLLERTGNTVFVVSVQCDMLKKFRAGDKTPVTQYAVYYTPTQFISLTLPGDDASLRQQLCGEMRKQGDAPLEQAKEIAEQRFKELSANASVNKMSNIGVLQEDTHGCYIGVLVGMQVENKPITMLGIVTSTVLKNKPMFFAVYDTYTGTEAVAVNVVKSQETATDLDAANK